MACLSISNSYSRCTDATYACLTQVYILYFVDSYTNLPLNCSQWLFFIHIAWDFLEIHGMLVLIFFISYAKGTWDIYEDLF